MALSAAQREALALDRRVWGSTRAVLDILDGQLSTREFRVVHAAGIAGRLGIMPATMSNALARLVKMQILMRDTRTGRSIRYKLNAQWPEITEKA